MREYETLTLNKSSKFEYFKYVRYEGYLTKKKEKFYACKNDRKYRIGLFFFPTSKNMEKTGSCTLFLTRY